MQQHAAPVQHAAPAQHAAPQGDDKKKQP
jgi:hypothetical protein